MFWSVGCRLRTSRIFATQLKTSNHLIIVQGRGSKFEARHVLKWRWCRQSTVLGWQVYWRQRKIEDVLRSIHGILTPIYSPPAVWFQVRWSNSSNNNEDDDNDEKEKILWACAAASLDIFINDRWYGEFCTTIICYRLDIDIAEYIIVDISIWPLLISSRLRCSWLGFGGLQCDK